MLQYFEPKDFESQNFKPERDYGTPPSLSEATVTLRIDGREVAVPAGTSVLRAAAELGIKVPKLCATDSLQSFGSCRMCMVAIEGRKGYPVSCTTPVEPGMVVTTMPFSAGVVQDAG